MSASTLVEKLIDKINSNILSEPVTKIKIIKINMIELNGLLKFNFFEINKIISIIWLLEKFSAPIKIFINGMIEAKLNISLIDKKKLKIDSVINCKILNFER